MTTSPSRPGCAGPGRRSHDLRAGYYTGRIDKGKTLRNHIGQMEALEYTVALTQAG